MRRRLVRAYVAAGVVSVTYRAWAGTSNPDTLRHVAGGVLLWPVVWVLDGLSPLLDSDDDDLDVDWCTSCGRRVPMQWRKDEDWVASRYCAPCLHGPVDA